MKHLLLPVVITGFLLAGCHAVQSSDQVTASAASAPSDSRDWVEIPGPTNGIVFRLYTNASPDSPHLFNTLSIEAYGETLMQSPGGGDLQRWLARPPAKASLHNLLVNGAGPDLAPTNGMRVIEQAVGPDWSYIALDASAAYRGRLERFKRSIVFVEPGLVVLYDHLAAKEPSRFRMSLHMPVATYVDSVWRDLRLELPKAGLTIQTPGFRNHAGDRQWVESPVDNILPNTVAMQLGPTNQLASLDLLTVFAIHPGGQKQELASKLLQSTTAVGARIFREGLPTLVVFRSDPSADRPSLAGFDFKGPVGVYVYRPKPREPRPATSGPR